MVARHESNPVRPTLIVLIASSLVFPLLNLSTIVTAREQTQQEQSVPPDILFREESSGRESKKGALTASFNNYRSSDGVFLRRRIEEFESDQQAAREIRVLRAQGETIPESKQPENKSKPLSDRIVLRWTHPERSDTKFAILWREGRNVYVLESSSLPHLKAFEQQVYGPGHK
jgi:hypothetical protein